MTELDYFEADRLGDIELKRDSSVYSVPVVTVTLYNDMETLVIRMNRSVAAKLALNMTAMLARDSLDYLNDQE